MRILHVAALPFPSPQGTQGLIAAMLRADAAAGHDTHLLCYPDGQGVPPANVHVHRAARVGARTEDFRSGPSGKKLVLDLALARTLRRVVASHAPALVIAHHVEAAACCALVLRGAPWAFCLHTSLAEELPSYFSAWMAPFWRPAGALLDRALSASAPRVLTVSPLLARSFRAVGARALPLPWPLPPAIEPAERASARRSLGLAEDARVIAYLGNLDAYQGMPVLAAALALACERDPGLRWLVATASPEAALRRLLAPHPALASRTVVLALDTELVRRKVHAAASVVAVPRLAPGGVPIKLLDALARGVPVVASDVALAGYALDGVCTVVANDVQAWCRALLASPADGEPGRGVVGRDFAPALYVAALAAIRASFLA